MKEVLIQSELRCLQVPELLSWFPLSADVGSGVSLWDSKEAISFGLTPLSRHSWAVFTCGGYFSTSPTACYINDPFVLMPIS